MSEVVTKRLRVYGIVQGVGFRPTVSRHAAEQGITGTVSNCGPYVEIIAQGTADRVKSFIDAVEHRPPMRAVILRLQVRDLPEAPNYVTFEIVESEKTRGEIFISPDIAICDTCKTELYDPKDRRYLHPFINCTCCGPRLTILDALPYDRERTSMKKFPMCPDCAREYVSPESRRYDAQPVCCPDCGPRVYLLGRQETGHAAISETRRIISAGGIAAIKGIGGFHLCCDATNPAAVQLLRDRKHRPAKPFAVMMRDEHAAEKYCVLNDQQMEMLTGHQKPIQLLRKLKNAPIADNVAPGNPKLGIMLPYAPVQLLLFDYDDGIQMPDCLVMTSGNVSGAPICRDDDGAIKELAHLCDCILSHDRDIRIRADDTVLDWYDEKPYMVRRSRGFAPLPAVTTFGLPGQVLAMGGELKNSFCVTSGDLHYVSPYIGDLTDVRTVDALKETVGRFQELLEAKPQIVVCDLHPGYNSSRVAEELGLPVLRVQHHYAHILSCMAENDYHGEVIGVSFDGTGYGTDATIWGGELLRCGYDSFTRLGSIQPFQQAGGDAASREGWRIAVSLLHAVLGDWDETISAAERFQLCSAAQAKMVRFMVEQQVNCVTSTSAGRLFDGVSALLGIRTASTFEGEASTALQWAAERCRENQQLHTPLEPAILEEDGLIHLNTIGLFREAFLGRSAGESPEFLAWQFHRGLADEIIAACISAREKIGLRTAALSGGVFQNLLLLDMTRQGLLDAGFQVLIHSAVPPNDGGIALGQAAAGLFELNKSNDEIGG